MGIKVALNGPGRTGKNFIWSWIERKRDGKTDLELVAINGIRGVEDDKGVEFFVELLSFDSTHGFHFEHIPHGRDKEGNAWIELSDQKVYLYNNREDLSKLPWKKHGVDVVIESSGRYRKREQVEDHLKAGARKVIVSAPSKGGIDTSVVLGVKEDIPKDENVIDCASCTTNAIAPVAKIVNDNWGTPPPMTRIFLTAPTRTSGGRDR
jgi:glyceraldehyde 3-phosphate dehydrogenase